MLDAPDGALLNNHLVLSVVVPAYNEESRLGSTLKQLVAYLDSRQSGFEILVVNDGSTDKTLEVANQIASQRLEVKLLGYDTNRGKGYAVRYGVLRTVGDFVLFCDADMATPIEEMEKLLAALNSGADIAIGSRDMRGSQLDKRQSVVREIGGKLFNRVVRLLTVPGIHDTQCGFKMFKRPAGQAVFQNCQVDNFAFDVEALFLATKVMGLKVAEVPVRWAHQEGSKVRFLRDGMRMLLAVWHIRTTRYKPTTESKLELHSR